MVLQLTILVPRMFCLQQRPEVSAQTSVPKVVMDSLEERFSLVPKVVVDSLEERFSPDVPNLHVIANPVTNGTFNSDSFNYKIILPVVETLLTSLH